MVRNSGPYDARHFSVDEALAALVGRYSEAMGVAVIVSDKELGLSVVAIHYLRPIFYSCAALERADLSKTPDICRSDWFWMQERSATDYRIAPDIIRLGLAFVGISAITP